jgi:glycosyltransferase involved in cell wall biosynthesis
MKTVLVFPGWNDSDYYKLLYKGMNEICYASYWGAIFPLVKNTRRHKTRVIHLHWIADYLALNKKWSLEFIAKLVLSIIDILIVRFIYQIPIVWTIHNLYEHESKHKRIEKVVRKFLGMVSRNVIIMGEIGKELIQKEFNIQNSKTHVIPHGTFNNLYPRTPKSKKEIKDALKIPNKNLVYLMAGSIKKYKGAKNAIQSFTKWNAPNTTLVIAGKFDPDQKSLLKCSSENIILIDKYLSEIELVEFYKCCDWVIAPYESIFTSGTIACAIGFNKPIIAPKIGLIPNYVSRQSGILYNNNDECGLLSTLKNSRKFLKSKKKYYSTEFHTSIEWNLIRKKTKTVLLKNEK